MASRSKEFDHPRVFAHDPPVWRFHQDTSDPVTSSIRGVTLRLAAPWRALPRFSHGKEETFPEYWWRIEQILTAPGADGYDQLNDDGEDATPLIHEGTEVEAASADDETVSVPENTTKPRV